MKIKCSKCGKTYDIDRSRYPDEGGNVACRMCDGVVTIPGLERAAVN